MVAALISRTLPISSLNYYHYVLSAIPIGTLYLVWLTYISPERKSVRCDNCKDIWLIPHNIR